MVFLGIISNFLIPTLISFVCSFFFGVPLICFCDDGDDSENSNKAGREESIGARSPGEGASAEPSYRKRRADPGDDVGPSSVRRRLESEKESNPAFTADPEINARVAPPSFLPRPISVAGPPHNRIRLCPSTEEWKDFTA